jgi:type III secretion system YscQ/HrcQ family protein
MTRLSGWVARRRWVLDALQPALGCPLEIEVQGLGLWRQRPSADDQLQVILLEHADSSLQAMLAIDAPLAVDLAWLCLTGDHEPSMAAPRPLDRVERGALLYLAARTVWAFWGKDGPMRVARLASAEELERLGHGAVTMHLTIRAGACAGHVWLHLPPTMSQLLPHDPPDRAVDGESLDHLPAMVHVALGRSRISLAELFGASPGDALLLDEVWARPTAAGVFRGQVRLRLAQGRPRWTASLGPQGAVALVDMITSHQEAAVMDPADDTLPSNPGELLSEIPIEISVELGRITLTAREAVALRPGQTLRLDRRPGDPVELRVGPKLVARGELVEVDGDLGVLLREIYQPNRG